MSDPEAGELNPYRELGGEAGLRELVGRFYDAMERRPDARGIREMHASDLTPMREALFDYLSGWLGGPPRYFDRAESKCIRSVHAPYRIGTPERDAWLRCMAEAMGAQGIEESLHVILYDAFLKFADALRNESRMVGATRSAGS